jgi:hypothetical protein
MIFTGKTEVVGENLFPIKTLNDELRHGKLLFISTQSIL